MRVYYNFKDLGELYYKALVPTSKYDKKTARIYAYTQDNKLIEEISFKFKKLAEKEFDRHLKLSKKDKKTLDEKLNEFINKLNFD